MFTRKFAVSAVERALKTFAQTLTSTLIVGTGILDVEWEAALSVSGLATLLSLLSSIVSSGVGPDHSPSLVGEPATKPDAVL